MINVMDNVKRYINAITDLISYCDINYQSMPWIVNTMGMCNSLGLKLLAYIILSIKPTFVLQIECKISKKRFECLVNAQKLNTLYNELYKNNDIFKEISVPENIHYNFIVSKQSVNTGKGTLVPKDERYLNFLAYFGELLDIHKRTGFLGIVPYM